MMPLMLRYCLLLRERRRAIALYGESALCCQRVAEDAARRACGAARDDTRDAARYARSIRVTPHAALPRCCRRLLRLRRRQDAAYAYADAFMLPRCATHAAAFAATPLLFCCSHSYAAAITVYDVTPCYAFATLPMLPFCHAPYARRRLIRALRYAIDIDSVLRCCCRVVTCCYDMLCAAA